MTKDNKPTRPILTLGGFKNSNLDTISASKKAAIDLPEKQINKNNDSILPITDTQSVSLQNISPKEVASEKLPTTYTALVKEEVTVSKPKHFISNEDYQLIIKYMRTHYTKCFPTNSSLLPLAIGIDKQIMEIPDLPFSRVKIRKFLNKYTKSSYYRKQLIEGNDRTHLDGSTGTKISEQEVPKWTQTTKVKKKHMPKNTEIKQT